MLDKKKILFDRDEKGELIPKTVKLIGTEEDVRITPLTRAEFIKYQGQGNETDQQAEIIFNHLVEPKLTKEEIDKGLKTGYGIQIFGTIMKHSGLSIEKDEKLDGEKEDVDSLKDFQKGKGNVNGES